MSEEYKNEDGQRVVDTRVEVIPEDSEHPINIPRIAVKDSRADVTLARADVAHEKSRKDAEADRRHDQDEANARPIDIPRLPVPHQNREEVVTRIGVIEVPANDKIAEFDRKEDADAENAEHEVPGSPNSDEVAKFERENATNSGEPYPVNENYPFQNEENQNTN